MTGCSRLVKIYEDKGTLDRVQGDTASTAAAWLVQAKDDLEGVRTLVEGESYRLAFNAACTTMRHAAEVVVQRAGGRVTSAGGGHEAVFALADALIGEDDSGRRCLVAAQGPSRLKRHNLEYISDSPVAVNEADAREVLQWATEAVTAAASFLACARRRRRSERAVGSRPCRESCRFQTQASRRVGTSPGLDGPARAPLP